MWLESYRQHNLLWNEPSDLLVPCRVDVWANADFETAEPGQADAFIVGRILADEIHRYEIEERGENIWQVADSDSSGVEAAWASVLDEKGDFRQNDFEGMADPVVYVYRFALHPDFAECRLAVMDLFCRTFGNNALILAQFETTVFSETEFEELGFRDLQQTRSPPPAGVSPARRTRSAPPVESGHDNRGVDFKARENSLKVPFTVDDYPDDVPAATARHAEWVEKEVPEDDYF